MSKLLLAPFATLILSACASGSAPKPLTAAEVTLIAREGPTGEPKQVPAAELSTWSACLGKLERIELDELLKLVLEEGEYRLDLTDATGSRRLVLHNSQDLSEGSATYYRSACAHDLVKALFGSAKP